MPTDEGFSNRLAEHLGSEELDEAIQTFLRDNARRCFTEGLDSESKGTGYSMEAYDIYQQYLAMSENHIVGEIPWGSRSLTYLAR